MKSKKGNMGLPALITAGVSLVILAVVLTIGADIVDEVQDTQTTDSYAFNASDQGLQGIDQLASWQSIIALVIAAGVVIGIIMLALAPRAGL